MPEVIQILEDSETSSFWLSGQVERWTEEEAYSRWENDPCRAMELRFAGRGCPSGRELCWFGSLSLPDRRSPFLLIPPRCLVLSLARCRSPQNTHERQWHEPHRTHKGTCVTEPSAGAVAPLDSDLACQPDVRDRGGILSIS